MNTHSAVGCYEDTQMKQLFIVMEYCAGGDLDRAVQMARMNNQPFPEEKIKSWFVQVPPTALRVLKEFDSQPIG